MVSLQPEIECVICIQSTEDAKAETESCQKKCNGRSSRKNRQEQAKVNAVVG